MRGFIKNLPIKILEDIGVLGSFWKSKEICERGRKTWSSIKY